VWVRGPSLLQGDSEAGIGSRAPEELGGGKGMARWESDSHDLWVPDGLQDPKRIPRPPAQRR
jgi:hypothetical protein